MNCANHPETPVAAYCQFCGKPLCDQCIHKINNIVGCEPCLAARVQAATEGSYGPNVSYGQGSPSTGIGSLPPDNIQSQPWGTEPWLAFVLGFIPGVGAMYNGQFAKGLAHVVIFALLADLAHYNGILGLLTAAWVVYQIFDAYQTAIARREGLPLPNPLGLNNIGQWFGARTHWPHAGANPWHVNQGNTGAPHANPIPPNPPAPSAGMRDPAQTSGFASHFAPPYIAPPIPPVPPREYNPHDFWHSGCSRGIPTGAVVLIVLGVAFLLGNLGILNVYWMDRGWPILLIALGVWLIVRRRQAPPPGGVR